VWLGRQAPLVAACGPVDLTLEETLAETRAAYEDAQERLERCLRCGDADGLCAGQNTLVPEGKFPVWEERKLTSRTCDTYLEWRIRKLCVLAGIPPRYADRDLETFEPAHRSQIEAVVSGLVARHSVWLVVFVPPGEFAVTVASGIARPCMRRDPPIGVAYVHLGRSKRDLQRHYGGHTQDDPLDAAHSRPVAILDGFEDVARQPQWMRDEIDTLISSRWARDQSTILLVERVLSKRKDTGTVIDRWATDELESAYPGSAVAIKNSCHLVLTEFYKGAQ
jgi:hypothetical protein